MALLGLFTKRDKSKPPRSSTTTKSSGASAADSASVADMSDYVLPDIPSPSATSSPIYGQIPAEASSSKFHLGFHRKKSTPASDVTETKLVPPSMPHSTSSSRSEAHLDQIRPPPDRAALFSAYNDPHNALSTRSLPTHADHGTRGSQDMGNNETQTNTEGPPVPKKPGGLFSWAHRERKKSKPGDAPPVLNVDVNAESFNLKSFRHVGPESPSADSAISLLPPARPRPRGDSVASDSSQRISVAAFREMAARKSTVSTHSSSPVLLRPPSRSDSLENAMLRASPSSFARGSPMPTRSSTLAVSTTDSSASDSEESSAEESEESAASSTMRPKRQRTITQKSPGGRAKSELGHRRISPTFQPTQAKSSTGHSEVPRKDQTSQNPKVGASGGFYRTRSSVSTSALQPNAAAKRASLRAAATKPVALPSEKARGKAPARDSDTDDTDNSSDEDSDDAPLASFVRPPRPGSSASNQTSGSRTRAPTKPLIDISQLGVTSTPSIPSSIDRVFTPPQKSKSPPVPEKDRRGSASTADKPSNSTRPTHPDKPSISDRLARIAQTAGGKSVENLASVAPLERRSLDSRPMLSDDNERGRIPRPTRSQTAPLDMFDKSSPSSPSTPASGTTRPPKGRTLSTTSAAVYDLTDPTPIVPTPIRERSPPPAFSVTSRPSSQLSLNTNPRLSGSQATVRMVGGSGSASSSPTSSTFPISTTTNSTSSSGPSTSPPAFFSSIPASSQFAQASVPTSTAGRPLLGSRQRSSTLIPDATSPSTAGFTGGGLLASQAAAPTDTKPNKSSQPASAIRQRQRSSTLLPKMDVAPPSRPSIDRDSVANTDSGRIPSSFSKDQSQQAQHRFPPRSRNPFNTPNTNTSSSPHGFASPPEKPFAAPGRDYSPSSSTGDSSSGRTPLTPADGSDYGPSDKRSVLSSATGVRKGHRRNVSFEDESDKRSTVTKVKDADADEERRKERRRSEAKAAIEFGKVVNGKITLDPDDEDLPLNAMGSRMPMANPMLSFTPPSPMPWATPPGMPMMSPQPFMPPQPNADPRFLAAHQHAMMVAKQAYQMAVAQQAMAAANDEWERGSSVSAFGGMSGGMGGVGMGIGMPMGMGGLMPGYGMNFPMFPSSQTMYTGSVAGSELGVGWGSRSEYGGPSRASRTSAMFSNRQSSYGMGMGSGQSEYGISSSAPNPNARPPIRPRTKTAPSDAQLPAQHSRSRPPPPSSWKSGPNARTG